MEVDRTGSQIIATGLSDPGDATPRQERSEDDDRRSHLADEMERGLGSDLGRYNHIELVPVALHVTTDVLENLGHDGHVEDVGDVGELVPTGSEESRCHLLQDCVLGTEDTNGPANDRASLDYDLTHRPQSTDCWLRTHAAGEHRPPRWCPSERKAHLVRANAN